MIKIRAIFFILLPIFGFGLGTLSDVSRRSTNQRMLTPEKNKLLGEQNEEKVKIVCVIPENLNSPMKYAESDEYVTWIDVMQQISKRVQWADEREFSMIVVPYSVTNPNCFEVIEQSCKDADIFIATGISDQMPAIDLAQLIEKAQIPTRLVFDSFSELEAITKLGKYRPSSFAGLPSRLSLVRSILRGGSGDDRALFKLVNDFYRRCSSEDLTFMILSLINAYVTPVPAAQGLGKKGGLRMLGCIVRNCRSQLLTCVNQPSCKACLECLDKCPPNDQVCAYRCITSYESPAMEQFSLCVMTKHNCMKNTADLPKMPNPMPMNTFRGQNLDFETAEDILIGWLGIDDTNQNLKKWSWKIACGQNPAYDYFPNQHQIFYRGKGVGQVWYDPVFQVDTLSGETVWRRRHYRVRRGSVPGTFYFSVLDNGVTSKEYWRIVDAADDLSWVCFYYSGAAAAAGQSYAGAVLGTPEGDWPPSDVLPSVKKAFEKCGIEMWELYTCQNPPTLGAPLDVPPAFINLQLPNRLVT